MTTQSYAEPKVPLWSSSPWMFRHLLPSVSAAHGAKVIYKILQSGMRMISQHKSYNFTHHVMILVKSEHHHYRRLVAHLGAAKNKFDKKSHALRRLRSKQPSVHILSRAHHRLSEASSSTTRSLSTISFPRGPLRSWHAYGIILFLPQVNETALFTLPFTSCSAAIVLHARA